MTQYAVSAKSISKNYGNLRALDSVSLLVPEGSFFGLLGPNGAGKTTLIGVLGGLVIADSGSAQIMGSDVVKESLAARRKVGIVPQELLYDPFFTVRESLTFQSKYYGIHDNQQWIDTLLTKLNLNDKTDVNTRKLSGGMKRRLMIAQALVHRPPVIVLDEPTAGVDINLRLSLWEFIRDLNRQGHTIILTTHYLEEAETLCEFVALMQDGKVIVRDKTKTLLADCHTDVRVRVRISADNTAVSHADNLPPHTTNNGFLLFTLKEYRDIEPLLASFRNANLEISEMQVKPPALEDIFMQVMRKKYDRI